jgi:hypothetical protein
VQSFLVPMYGVGGEFEFLPTEPLCVTLYSFHRLASLSRSLDIHRGCLPRIPHHDVDQQGHRDTPRQVVVEAEQLPADARVKSTRIATLEIRAAASSIKSASRLNPFNLRLEGRINRVIRLGVVRRLKKEYILPISRAKATDHLFRKYEPE